MTTRYSVKEIADKMDEAAPGATQWANPRIRSIESSYSIGRLIWWCAQAVVAGLAVGAFIYLLTIGGGAW